MSLWRENLEKVKEAGIGTIRFGEFAWIKMEPTQGEFDWGWMDRAIDLAAEMGIEVMLGTPTACPPIWLVEAHPDMMPVNREGRRSTFGVRQHRCFNAPAYLERSAAIVREMAERYGQHSNVTSWQIDNELGAEHKTCYCEHCRVAFQSYLEERYGSIDELNRRWGTMFWSQSYQRWDPIPLPMKPATYLPVRNHPSLEFEFARFCSDSIIRFSNMQARILKQHTDRTVMTNQDAFTLGDNLDVYKLFRELDIGAIDLYLQESYEIAFYFDLFRSVAGGEAFWLVEFDAKSPVLLEAMELAGERGCELFSLFAMNPFPWGQEQGGFGLVSITGDPTPNYERLRELKDEPHAPKLAVRKPRVGLFYSFDSSWAYSIAHFNDYQSLESQFSSKLVYPNYVVHTLYRSLFESGVPVQFAFSPEQAAGFDVLIVPWQLIHDSALEHALLRFVSEGGRLVSTPDLFVRNEDNAYFPETTAFYREVLGPEQRRFLPDEEGDACTVQLSSSYGQGEVIFVRRKADQKQWKEIIERYVK